MKASNERLSGDGGPDLGCHGTVNVYSILAERARKHHEKRKKNDNLQETKRIFNIKM